jgi:hypothetical protein
VHHLLALYDLGAPADIINASYKRESTYQRPFSSVPAPKEAPDLRQPEVRKLHLGRHEAYGSFLAYFSAEIAQHGLPAVVNNTLFSGSEEADDMLVRLFAGFLHPFIHVGYGLEFSQPAIVAEGLAMAAVQDSWMRELFLPAEEEARSEKREGATLVKLLEEIRKDEKVRLAPRWTDGNKVKGILQRASEGMRGYTARYKVPVEQLEEKMAESINAAALFTAAAQRAEKEIRIDF